MEVTTTTVYCEIQLTFIAQPTPQIVYTQSTTFDEGLLRTLLFRIAGLSEVKISTNLYRNEVVLADQKLVFYYSKNGPFLSAGVLLALRDDQPELDPARNYAAYLIIRGLEDADPNLNSGLHVQLDVPSRTAARAVTALFEEHLLFDAFEKVGWTFTGRQKFEKSVHFYTERSLSVQMALPAFPCKSTNPYKIADYVPDAGEFEALASLLAFCDAVADVYTPGCFINIVSDGHVFSDCQGTDDDVVEAYNLALKAMLGTLQNSRGDKAGGVKFYDLTQLLFPEPQADVRPLFDAVAPTLPKVTHPVTTAINPTNDAHRALMLAIWGPPEVYLADLLKSQPDHPMTALYRGFSRFMFEDLAYLRAYARLSKSARKNVAESVAREMLRRNQTYSRLVEGVLPRHVRLSIHAHDNAGPKFAIRVLPRDFVRADTVADLLRGQEKEVRAVTEEDALARETQHIPTPWHNCLVDVLDVSGRHRGSYICKSGVALEAMRAESMTGGYQKGHERGGRFVLKMVGA